MKAYYQRVFAIILAVLLVCPLLPGPPLAFVAKAAGTEPVLVNDPQGNYYAITSEDNLKYIASQAESYSTGKTFKQTKDFVSSQINIFLNPLNGYAVAFGGTYDGNGYTITVKPSGDSFILNYAGCVFSKVTGTVKNLNVYLEGVQISTGTSSGYLIGGIASELSGGTIENCSVSGSLVTTQSRYGLWDHFNNVTYTDYAYTGGITGKMSDNAKISGCYTSDLTIECRANTGDYYTNTYNNVRRYAYYRYGLFAGGIAGWINSSGSIISDCLIENTQIIAGRTGNSQTVSFAGGIFGYESDSGGGFTVTNNYLKGSKIYANKTVAGGDTGAGGAAGGIAGWIRATKIPNLKNNYAAESASSVTFGTVRSEISLNLKDSAYYYTKKTQDIFSYYDFLGAWNNGDATSTQVLFWGTTPRPDQLTSGIWVNDIVNASGTNLKIRTTDAPPEPDYDPDPFSPTDTTNKITFSLPANKPASVADANWKLENIRYEITYYATAGTTMKTIAHPQNSATTVNGLEVALNDTVENGSTVTVKTWMNAQVAPFPRVATYRHTVGQVTKPPIIALDKANYSVVISGEANDHIYYTYSTSTSSAEPADFAPPDPDNPVTGQSGTTSITIALTGFAPAEWTKLTIKAVAKKAGGSYFKSSVEEANFDYTVKKKAGPPKMTFNRGQTLLSDSEFYEIGNTIEFQNPDGVTGGSIYYTTSGLAPDAQYGTLYDPQKPYTLPPGANEVRISAICVRPGYPDSEIESRLFKIKASHGLPVFSAENEATVPIAKQISLIIPPGNYPDEYMPDYYSKGDGAMYTFEQVQNDPGDYYGVYIAPNSSFDYNAYLSAYLANMPIVKYRIGNGGEKTYTPSTPEIGYYETQGSEQVYRLLKSSQISFFPLPGEAGESVTVSTKLTPRNTSAYTEGEWNTQTYNFYMPVKTPTASPNTDDNTIKVLNAGSTVSLSCPTASAQIFYSLTSGTLTVELDSATGRYVARDDAGTATRTTFEYDAAVAARGIPVTGNPGQFFTIYAGAVKAGMSPSEIAKFTYQLPAPVQAVYASPVEGTVVKGTEITLSTTTADATIFYETASREGNLEDPMPGQSQVYSKPIKIEERTYISAMAVKNGVESSITEYYYRVAGQVDAPEPSVSSGSVVAKGTKVSFTSYTDGASFTYTKDGSDPTDEKNTKRMYGPEIAIDAEEGKSVSISIYAHRTGMTPSGIVSVSYTVSKSGEVMTANPAADSTVKPGDRITLSTSVTGSEIYYTTDGSEPTRDSQRGSTVVVDGAHGETFIIRAVAATESTITAPYIFSYKVVARTPAPSASIPNGAIILEGATVTLTAPEGNIYYTTDGGDPTSGSQMYTEPFKLTGSTVLKAIAIADDKAQSETAEYIYTMAGQVAAPTASQPGGTIDVGSKIALTTTTEDATIYYTTNGATPTADNLRDCFTYEGPITISRPVSIRMFAVKTGMNASVVNTVTYTVAYPVEEEEEEQDTSAIQRDTDRLFLFDQFVDSGEGSLFEDIVLRDNLTLTVVSAAGNALPEGVRLVAVRERSPSAEDEDAASRALDMQLGTLYNISLVDQSGNPVQPLLENGVEIGVPIPEGYEDTIVLICRINDNGTVTAFPTRRSAGMLYAVVDHFSKYVVAVPAPLETKGSWYKSWYLWLLAAGTVMAGAAALIVVFVRKRKKTKATAD